MPTGVALFGNEIGHTATDVDQEADSQRELSFLREVPDLLFLAVLVNLEVSLFEGVDKLVVLAPNRGKYVDQVDAAFNDRFVVIDSDLRLRFSGLWGGRLGLREGEGSGREQHSGCKEDFAGHTESMTRSKGKGFSHKKAVAHLTGVDPVMAGIIGKVGALKIQYHEPTFQTLVRSIVYQQLSGKAAATILGRLLEAAGTPLTPEGILKLRVPKMRSLGLSAAKTDYIRGLAKMAKSGEVDFEGCAGLEDAAVVEHLTKVKGVGVWTVHMFLLFALRRPDVLPTGDLGVRAAIKKAYGLEALPAPKEMEKIAASWRPYCSVATWYLWRSIDGAAGM